MIWSKKFFILVVLVMFVAVALRLPRLRQRPMHGDEAVHAVKFGELLETNSYRYNQDEYHGPTLNYFTLIPSWLSGIHKYKDLNEFTLRIVPVFFSLLLVLMTLLLLDGLGRMATIMAMAMTAVSPAFVFYSRYYIHEMLLVCFSFGIIVCGWRYARSKKIIWAILVGVFIGLCHATKETCIIVFASMLLALLFSLSMQRSREGSPGVPEVIKSSHIIVILITAAVVSALFYSSFFTNPGGIFDSFMSYATYFNLAAHDNLHKHPWHYYLDILTWMEGFEKLTWNEDFIIVAAVFGFTVMLFKRYRAPFNLPLIRFFAFYTLIMTAIYSAIPYKTPWCLLGFLQGMILLAAVGVTALIRGTQLWWEKTVIWFLLAFFGLLLPAMQAYALNYKYYTAPSSPYVYAHPTKDVFDIARRMEQVAEVCPEGHNIYIQVICPAGDYWPLPWYLRSFTNIGWWSDVDEQTPAAPVIIASPKLEPALIRKLYELPPPGQRPLYIPLFDSYTELRPGVELRGFVTKEISDRLPQSQPTGKE